jgi:hypothetical protein
VKPYKSTKPPLNGVVCNGFDSPWVCNCGCTWGNHEQHWEEINPAQDPEKMLALMQAYEASQVAGQGQGTALASVSKGSMSYDDRPVPYETFNPTQDIQNTQRRSERRGMSNEIFAGLEAAQIMNAGMDVLAHGLKRGGFDRSQSQIISTSRARPRDQSNGMMTTQSQGQGSHDQENERKAALSGLKKRLAQHGRSKDKDENTMP